MKIIHTDALQFKHIREHISEAFPWLIWNEKDIHGRDLWFGCSVKRRVLFGKILQPHFHLEVERCSFTEHLYRITFCTNEEQQAKTMEIAEYMGQTTFDDASFDVVVQVGA